MTYERFEDLPVWKAAIEFANRMFGLTEGPQFKGRFSLRDQIERATVSISNNIAEGFERGTTQELLTFLYIARGSAGEVRSMLCLLDTLPAFSNLKSEISRRRHFASIARLGRFASEFQDQRATLPDRESTPSTKSRPRTQRVSGKNFV